MLYVVNAFYGLQPIIKHNPISFGMFISITIFLCSFPFPLIIYPIDNSFSLFSFGYNHNVMTKCTALVCVAHSAYWFGVEIAKEKYIRKLFVNKITVDDFLIKKFIRYVIILFALFIGLGGLKFFTDRYLDGNMSSNVTFTYINLIFTTISILLACMCLFANNKKVLHLATIVLFMVCITILFTGSRTLPMFLMLPLAYVYQKKYNISMTKMGICLLVILVFFIIVGQIRHSVISIDAFSSYENNDSEFGVWGNFTDLKDSMELVKRIDYNSLVKGRLVSAYTPSYENLILRSIANMYRLGYSYQHKKKCFNCIKVELLPKIEMSNTVLWWGFKKIPTNILIFIFNILTIIRN